MKRKGPKKPEGDGEKGEGRNLGAEQSIDWQECDYDEDEDFFDGDPDDEPGRARRDSGVRRHRGRSARGTYRDEWDPE